MRLANKKFLPSRRLIAVFILFAVVESLVVFHFQVMMGVDLPDRYRTFSLALAFSVLGLALLDLLAGLRRSPIELERKLAGSMAVNRWKRIELRVTHNYLVGLPVQLYDILPPGLEVSGMPATTRLQANKASIQYYQVRALQRGPMEIAACDVRQPSPLGLWNTQYRLAVTDEIKVYPDFSAISAYTILATDNHVSQIGIKRKPRRGEGLEFLQLREYRRGDSFRQVDWKASSRRQKLISREYQDERDQQIILLIDAGRRMRAIDESLSHFDHSLNALLLVSHIALNQGDSVSVLSFGKEQRWVPPQKGKASVKAILNAMYDLQAENCAPDYVGAAEKLASLQKKRSLVILVTNTRDEEVDELLLAANLLRKNHVVLLANIRENILDQLQDKEIRNLDDALTYSGVNQYLQTRSDVQQKIRNNGIYIIDCLAGELAVRVANSYLEIKRAGVL